MYPEPSANDHDAPWNWDDEEGCCCTACIRKAREEARIERGIDDGDSDDY